MKSFEEFWTSLTEEDFANFADIANERANSVLILLTLLMKELIPLKLRI